MKIDSRAASALKGLGVRPLKQKQYLAQMEKRFGGLATEFLNLADRKRLDSSIDLYSNKNANLDMSLLISSSQFFENHANLLTWLLKQNFDNVKTVVDLGCENGVLTCAMATLWPEKTIVGIDRNSAAIACANELAERHGLTNASFIEGDISETGSLDQILGADIYLAAWVTHEWFEATWRDSGENAEKGRETFSIDDISPHICESPKSLELIASQMNDVGSLITVNRFPRFEQSLSFHRLAELSGLQIKFPDSDVLNIETESGIEEFPIFSYRKSNEAVKPLPSETLYSLVNYQELKKRFCNKSFDDAAAEAIMALSDMRINVCTLTKKYPEDNAEEKIILALNDMFVITFHTTNLNFRSCRLAPACALDEMLQYVLEVAENTPESVESSFEFNSKVLDEAIINAFLFQPSELEAAFGNE